ncbi:MAG: efflux RND transporter permease subunit [Eubacterium sp.]|nr:efflux RND transporter permease subunit [Eubacterium sp.]
MLSKFSVKRPYTVLVGVVIVIVLGIVAYGKMTADLLPDMTFPYVIVITTDMGASPEEVEQDVTSKLEASLATTTNLKSMQSMSRNSFSTVILEYEQTANMDSTMIEIQQKMDQIKAGFPDSVGAPILMRINPDMLPIMVSAIGVDDMDPMLVSTYVDNTIIPQLESIEGVASVTASGGITETIQVSLNQEKVDKLNQRVLDEIESQFADAEAEIEKSREELEAGKAQLESGKEELANQISQGETMLNTQKFQLYSGEAEMKSKLEELTKTSGILDGVIKMLTEMAEVATEIQTNIQKLEAGIQELSKFLAQLTGMREYTEEDLFAAIGMTREEFEERIRELNEELENAIPQLAEWRKKREELEQKIQNMRDQISDMLKEAGIDLNSIEDLPSAIRQLQEMKAQVDMGIITIQNAQQQIASGKATLDTAMTALSKNEILGSLRLSDASAQMMTGAAALETAKKSIEDAKKKALEQADLNSVLSADVVRQLLVAQNMDLPAGYINEEDNTWLIKVGESIDTVDGLTNLVLIDLGMDSIGKVFLSDIADIEVKSNADTTYAKIDGKPGVLLTFEKQTGYATGDVTDAILARFESLEKTEDQSIHFSTLMDQGVYIDLIVKSILQNMLIGAALAILVLIIFLKDFRPTIIIACAIPLSVIFAIVLMYFSGISLNSISMSGLALGIGMLVDNSIVVIENIYRLRGQGMSIKMACVNGANQVAGAITSSTLTTVCVFAPIIFTEGITRQLFVDMALTILFTLGASLVVALTLVPAMATGMLKKPRKVKHGLYDRFLEWYGKKLRGVLRWKAVVFILALILLGFTGYMAYRNGTAFFPEMTSTQVTVTLSVPENETREFDEMTGYADQLMDRLSGNENIKTIGAMSGSGTLLASMGGVNLGGGSGGGSSSSSTNPRITMYVLLHEDSTISNEEIEKVITDAAEDLPCEVKVNTSMMDMGALTGTGITVQIKGRNLEGLQDLARKTAGILKNVEGIEDVNDGLTNTEQEILISVDKEKAAKYGMTVAQVFQLIYQKTAQTTSSMKLVTDIKDYDVYVNSAEQAAMTVDDLKKITFTYTNRITQESQEVKLTDIATFTEREELAVINRDSQTRFINVTATIKDNYNVGLVGNDVRSALKDMEVPEGFLVKMAGEDEAINEAISQLGLMLLLAVILIYLVMVAQFQSLLSPFIIMFTIPLAFTGGFMALAFTGNEFSIVAIVGFVMLSGIIVNNGIVLVDYINQLRREGMSKKDAIVESSKTRLRPVLMTALTTIISMSTMAMGMGRGTEMAQPMALVVVGGLIYGTLLTLLIVPCIYDAFNREKDMREEEITIIREEEDPELMIQPVGAQSEGDYVPTAMEYEPTAGEAYEPAEKPIDESDNPLA